MEQRGWITEADYKEGLALSQLMPGPLGAAVIGIIAMSAYKLTTKSIAKRKLLWAIYLVSGAITVITESEIGPRLVERRCRTTAGRWH